MNLKICREISDVHRLAFLHYIQCERKGWAEDARGYNETVTVWTAIEHASLEAGEIHTTRELEF